MAVDELMERAQAATAAIVPPAGRRPRGYAGAFAIPTGHIGMVRAGGQAARSRPCTPGRQGYGPHRRRPWPDRYTRRCPERRRAGRRLAGPCKVR
jgi:hypothetical protein